MIIVKKGLFPSLVIPLSVALFGKNKTLRGVLILPLLNGFLCWLVNWFIPVFESIEAFIIGAVLGLAYMISELPNSWLKRKLGIASGQRAKKNATFFLLLDKMDSAFGVSLVCKFIFEFSWVEAGILFLIAVSIHVFFSWFLVAIGVKRRF